MFKFFAKLQFFFHIAKDFAIFFAFFEELSIFLIFFLKS